ncbi:MAG: epoxyqueuosine reductase QueH [candidate division NC10 bacterium]|nr:epoxyqueuosine reductase QueH [candidate division NC10 bacterium]
MRILLHLCCAPCSTFCLESLRQEGHDLLGFFYNPNIHPFREYLLRQEAMQRYSREAALPVLWMPEEGMESFFRQVAFHEPDRCRICYRMRLFRAAEMASQRGYPAFTTTLLISPYQKHDLLREVGFEAAERTGVLFYYKDLRSGWRWSRQRAKELNLYRQTYCGCLYSEKERLLERRERKAWPLESTPLEKS